MPSRLERVVDVTVPQGETVGTVNIPRNIGMIQVVLDRQPFENATTVDNTVCSIDLFDARNDDYLGGVTWSGGRVEGDGVRPGQRMLWSWARWYLNGQRRIRYVLRAPTSFQCRLDVDLFTVSEL